MFWYHQLLDSYAQHVIYSVCRNKWISTLTLCLLFLLSGTKRMLLGKWSKRTSEDAIFWRFEIMCKSRIISLIPGITWFRNHTWSKLKSTRHSYSTHEQIRAAVTLYLHLSSHARKCMYLIGPHSRLTYFIVLHVSQSIPLSFFTVKYLLYPLFYKTKQVRWAVTSQNNVAEVPGSTPHHSQLSFLREPAEIH